MAANKNQHFVPKCHLKPFSLNEKGEAINVFNHQNNKGIKYAAVKGQCAKSYFYGKDLALEKAFQTMEGDYATVIKKIYQNLDSITKKDLSILKHFAFLQMNRTEANIKKRAIAHESMDEISHRGFENYKKDLDLSHEAMLISVMKSYIATRNTIKDLEVALLENKTNYNFITSDDPAISINRLYQQRLGGRAFGMASCGVQVLLPLTPRFYLICYDKNAYTAANKNGIIISIYKKQDVLTLNELQFIKCQNNIYFQNWEDLEQIKENFVLAAPRRPVTWIKFWVGVPTHEQDGYKYYRRAEEYEIPKAKQKIIAYNAVDIEPSRWISVLNYRQKIYGYTNGSGAGYIREGQISTFGRGIRFWKEEIVFSSKKFNPETVAIRL